MPRAKIRETWSVFDYNTRPQLVQSLGLELNQPTITVFEDNRQRWIETVKNPANHKGVRQIMIIFAKKNIWYETSIRFEYLVEIFMPPSPEYRENYTYTEMKIKVDTWIIDAGWEDCFSFNGGNTFSQLSITLVPRFNIFYLFTFIIYKHRCIIW